MLLCLLLAEAGSELGYMAGTLTLSLQLLALSCPLVLRLPGPKYSHRTNSSAVGCGAAATKLHASASPSRTCQL